jgi:hypothetical protein
MDKMAAYLKTLKAFKLAHLRDTQIWEDQPRREPEITTMRHCDTQQMIRNVFVFDGQMLIITDRDKNRAIRELGRKVTRFLPERMGKMVIAYIT